MTYLNFHSRSGWHVDEGVAVFSRFPIARAHHRVRPPPRVRFLSFSIGVIQPCRGRGGVMQVLSRDMDDIEDREHQRVCLRARIRPPGCRDLDFLVTHLTLSDPAR